VKTALTLVKLKWALTLAVLRKSVWQTVGFVISVLLGVGAVVAIGAFAWFLGSPSAAQAMSGSNNVDMLRAVIVLIGSFATVMVAFVQLMVIGEGSAMSSRRFGLYGIQDRELELGLFFSGLTGIPAITGFMSLLLWSSAYRWMGMGAVITAVCSAAVIVVTMLSISKMILSLSTTLVTSKRGKNVFYVVVMVLFIVAAQLPNLITSSLNSVHLDVAPLTHIADVFGFTPLGAGFELVFDVFHGDVLGFIIHLAIELATCIVCFAVCTWCLRHERLTFGTAQRQRRMKGVGAFSWMPDSVSGAISARLFTYLKRDPRQLVFYLMPVLFVVLFAIESQDVSVVAWQSLIWAGLFMNMSESNGIAYDGRGFTMQVLAGVNGRDDRRGRIRVFVGVETLYVAILAIVLLMVTGDWKTTNGILTALTFCAAGIAMALCSLGVSEFMSTMLMYPVASMDKPFSSPQGRALSQGFIPFLYMLFVGISAFPTIIGIAVVAGAGLWDRSYWLMAPISLLNAILVACLGMWLGGKLLDSRQVKIVATLDTFASLQK
jgi:ABC-2 type transport system permease protein